MTAAGARLSIRRLGLDDSRSCRDQRLQSWPAGCAEPTVPDDTWVVRDATREDTPEMVRALHLAVLRVAPTTPRQVAPDGFACSTPTLQGETMKKTHTPRVVALLLVLGLALTACSDTESSGGTSERHNDQDVAFATEMILHHAQAVRMSDMAADRAESQDVKDLAADISAAQGPEIEQMSAWLEAWDEDVPETPMGDMDGMDHGDMGGMEDMEDMPGMMSSEEMDELEAASGAQFDEMFLSMMIEHHEGAIDMARTEQAEGENPEAIALAETIERNQSKEIQSMEELLASM